MGTNGPQESWDARNSSGARTRQTSGRKGCWKNDRERLKQRKIDSHGRKINGWAIENATQSVVNATTKPHNKLME